MLGDIIENVKSRGLKDIFNPEKIQNYFDGKKIEKEGITLQYEEILAYSEQLVYRTIVCRECFTEGKCRDCKCPQPLAGMVVDHNCTEGNYEAMKSPEEWEEYKKETGIKFNIEYKS